jgi:hypothetical protein
MIPIPHVVQEDKLEVRAKDPEPRIIAAVAAFQRSDHNRTRLGLEKQESMPIPCITIVYTRQMFHGCPCSQDRNREADTPST